MDRRRTAYLAVNLISLVVVAAAWELYGRTAHAAVPPLSAVLHAWLQLARDGLLFPAVRFTLETYFSGLIVGAVVGALAGYLMARLPLIQAAAGPSVAILRATPMVALGPLITIWGTTIREQAIITALFAIWPMQSSVYRARHDSDTTSASALAYLASLPDVMTAALAGTILAELWTAVSGLGAELNVAAAGYHLDRVLAVILTIAAIGLVAREVVVIALSVVSPHPPAPSPILGEGESTGSSN